MGAGEAGREGLPVRGDRAPEQDRDGWIRGAGDLERRHAGRIRPDRGDRGRGAVVRRDPRAPRRPGHGPDRGGAPPAWPKPSTAGSSSGSAAASRSRRWAGSGSSRPSAWARMPAGELERPGMLATYQLWICILDEAFRGKGEGITDLYMMLKFWKN